MINNIDEIINLVVNNANEYISIEIITSTMIITVLKYRVYNIKEKE